MGLRTGSSTAERGAWPRSLRGTIVAGPTPSRAHDNDCLCLPAASTSHQSEAGKKESPDHHLNPACQPCAEPSSISSFDCRLINARTADNGSAQNGSTNKSAKVVLVPPSAILQHRCIEPPYNPHIKGKMAAWILDNLKNLTLEYLRREEMEMAR